MPFDFLNFYIHVLPRNSDGSGSEAFKLTRDTTHENLYRGLSIFPQDVKDELDLVYLDLFPKTTRALTEWSEAFDLWPSERTEQETRDALASAWRATGGQSPRYLQDRLQEAGFDVFVHDWWGDELPAGESFFDFKDRCYYENGIFPGTSQFTEGRATPGWKERDGALIEFDPFVIRDGEDGGLLVEPERTQLISDSTNFKTGSAWARDGVTVADTSAVIIQGLPSQTITEDSSTGFHRVSQDIAVTSGEPYCISAYVETVSRQFVQLDVDDAEFGDAFANFDLVNGIVTSTGAAVVATIRAAGSGFYITMCGTATSTATTTWHVALLDDLEAVSYVGDGSSAIRLSFVQLEIGTFPTSLIPFGGVILKTTVNGADVIVYDKTQDSVPTTWRSDDTRSWFNETLNTVIRGATRAFPDRVGILVETATVTIFDLTVAGNPMWKVWTFVSATSIAVLDGLITIGTTSGVVTIDMIQDDVHLRDTTGSQLADQDTASFNMSTVVWGAASGDGIVNNITNDVANISRSGAEADPIRLGLPFPTIAAATDGGASVINHDGSLANVDVVNDSITGASFNTVFFDDVGDLWVIRPGVGQTYRYDTTTYASDGFVIDNTYSSASIPAFLVSGEKGLAGTSALLVNGGDNGLTLLAQDTTQSNGMVVYVATTYSTVWMQGAIELALSDSLTDRSVAGTVVTDNGTAIIAAIASGADQKSITASGGTITAPVTTGGAIYGWEFIGGSWIFRRNTGWIGISEAAGTLTIDDGTTFAMLRYTNGAGPSVAQYDKMEPEELALTLPNALAFLQGSSNSVQRPSFDDISGKLAIPTTNGTDKFLGLLNVDHVGLSPATSVNHTSVSLVDDSLMIGTTAEAVYIPDDITRAADETTIPDIDTSNWFESDEFTVIMRATYNGEDAANPFGISFNDGTTADEVGFIVPPSKDLTMKVTSGGVEQVSIASGVTIVTGVPFNIAMRVKADDFAVTVDGAAVVTDASGLMSLGLDTVDFGRCAEVVELVENGDFVTDTTGWATGNGAIISVVSEKLNVENGISSPGRARQTITTEVGKTYDVIADFIRVDVNSRIIIGSADGLSDLANSGGKTSSQTIIMTFVAVGTQSFFSTRHDNATLGLSSQWDNISITEVNAPRLTKGGFTIESVQYLSRAAEDTELQAFSLAGPDECPVLDPLTVNIIGTEFAPFTGECGDVGVECGEDIQCGDKVDIQFGTYPPIRNALKVLNDGSGLIIFTGECGDPSVLCGAGFECGDTFTPQGYPLVNNILEIIPGYIDSILCGEELAECGEPLVLCGNNSPSAGFEFIDRQYTIPRDVLKWPHFVYVGGQIWPELAQVSALRRDEFETIILKLFPAHKWVGVLVEYI